MLRKGNLGPLSAPNPHAASCFVLASLVPALDLFFFLVVFLFWGWVRQLWKKYQKLETSRTALREAVKLLQAENEKLQKGNSELSKGYLSGYLTPYSVS